MMLHSLMQQADLSQAELARRTGIAQPVIHRLCTDETINPKLSTLSLLARHLGVTIDALVGEAPPMLPEPVRSRALLHELLSDLQNMAFVLNSTIQRVTQFLAEAEE